MAKRASLATFATKPPAPATGATVQAITTTQAAPAKAAAKYHKISVYLTAAEVRTIKLIGIDTGQGPSDIGAQAIREWLERNGHARSTTHNA